MVCSGWLKNDWLCLSLWRSSKCCVASWCNGLELDIRRPDQEDLLQHWEQQMHHSSVWILSWRCNSERISWSRTQQKWRWFNKKLIYFSDSCGRQYKNYKNFMNLDSINTHFAKCFISVNECLIRNTETRQYSSFWLPNLHYFFLT